jgi:hypothetical protein
MMELVSAGLARRLLGTRDVAVIRSFRQRPLTWLFVIATACVDAAAIAGAADHESNWFSAIALGQMFLVGALLVIGRTHRLVRATLFVVVPVVLSLPDYLSERPPRLMEWPRGTSVGDVAPHVLGITLILTALAALISFAMVALNYLATRQSAAADRGKLQFPIIEFFGWTIVVALATLVLQTGRYEYFRGQAVFDALAVSAFPVSLLTFFGVVNRTWFLKMALALAFFVSAVPFVLRAASADWQVVLGAYAYVAAWVLIQRMDGSIRAKHLAAGEER